MTRAQTIIEGVNSIREELGISVPSLRDDLTANYMPKGQAVSVGSVYGWMSRRRLPSAEGILALQEWLRKNKGNK